MIVVVVAGNQKKIKRRLRQKIKRKQRRRWNQTQNQTETAPADKESLDADELVEENFRQAGITEYEK